MSGDDGAERRPADVATVPARPKDVASGLRFRLERLDAERGRCQEQAARLAWWSTICKIAVVVLGVLVAAQGTFSAVWDDAWWLSLAFVGLGMLTAAAGGLDALFKPGERAPRLVSIGYEYERIRDALRLEADALRREVDLSTDEAKIAFGRSIDQLLRRSEAALTGIRERELSLYVSGPVGRRAGAGRRRRGPAASPR
jgi:hypothetical protein